MQTMPGVCSSSPLVIGIHHITSISIGIRKDDAKPRVSQDVAKGHLK